MTNMQSLMCVLWLQHYKNLQHLPKTADYMFVYQAVCDNIMVLESVAYLN